MGKFVLFCKDNELPSIFLLVMGKSLILSK